MPRTLPEADGALAFDSPLRSQRLNGRGAPLLDCYGKRWAKEGSFFRFSTCNADLSQAHKAYLILPAQKLKPKPAAACLDTAKHQAKAQPLPFPCLQVFCQRHIACSQWGIWFTNPYGASHPKRSGPPCTGSGPAGPRSCLRPSQGPPSRW